MATENMIVTTSTDDAEQGDTAPILTGTYIRWYQGGTCHAGFRFVPVATIPKGSTIISAVFSYKYTATDRDTLTATVWAEKSAGPVTFTTDANNVSGRTPTTTTASINETDAGIDWRTLDVAAILQEVVTAYDVTAIVIIGYDDSSDNARWVTYDGSSTDCPKLDVEYTPPATGQPTQLRATAVPHARQWTGRRL